MSRCPISQLADLRARRHTNRPRSGWLTFGFGLVAYGYFLSALVYTVGFVTGADFEVFGVAYVVKSIDHGGDSSSAVTVDAVAIDVALLALFAVQHSVMARPGFKRWWTRFVPASIERSTYVVASTSCLVLLYWAWRPVTAEVWRVDSEPGRSLLLALGLIGWAIPLFSTFLIDHLDLFGLRQTLAALRGRDLPEQPFATPLLYRIVRHPLYFGFLLAFWGAPTMTVGHLVFAAAASGYILVGARLEERDLVAAFGQQYRSYRARTPMLLPGVRRSVRHVDRGHGRTTQ